MNDVVIRPDDLRGPRIRELLREHLEDMAVHSPPESVHALDLDALRQPDIRFWAAWTVESERSTSAELMGCIALRTLTPTHGAIKSMRTKARFVRRGVGTQLLSHLINEARSSGIAQLSLETGSMAAFAPARALYERFGFRVCAPFGDYVEDTHSVCMTRSVD